ncbi:MAG: hypothetical protein AAGA54_03730 [Myxococcota bacterium]
MGLWVLPDVGPTTDEPWRMLNARAWTQALSTGSLAAIDACASVPYREFYGVAYDQLGRASWLVHHHVFDGDDEFFGRHLLNLFTAGLALLGTYRLGRTLADGRVGIVAMVLLATAPRFWGSAFMNPKDIPFAAATVWAAGAAFELAAQPSRRTLLRAAVLAGICAAVRPFGVVFFVLISLCVVLDRVEGTPWRTLAGRIVAAVLSAYATTFVLWPVLWVRPPWHLLDASTGLTRHVHGSMSLFFGKVHPFWDAPGGYVVVWLGITVPVPILLGALGAIVALSVELVRRRPPIRTAFPWVMLCAWVLGPACVPALKRTTLYDTSRHLLFLVPPLCILAALLWVRLGERTRTTRRVVSVVLGLGVLTCVRASVLLHPYASLYFNESVGGIEGAHGRFDVAHYSEAYREGFAWLRAHHPGAAVHVTGNGSALASYFGWKYGLRVNANDFAFYLSEVRQGWEHAMPGEVVHRISRQGVPLLEIRRVDPLTPARVLWVRRGASAAPPAPPQGDDDPAWTRVTSAEGAYDLGALVGGSGYVALRLSSSEPTAAMIWRYYEGLTIWSEGRRVFEGQAVPFQHRGTENFPSVMPIDVPVDAVDTPTWLILDVSKTRQYWSFGAYAPARTTRWIESAER